MSKKARNVAFPLNGSHLTDADMLAVDLMAKLDKKRYVPQAVLHRSGPIVKELKKAHISYTILDKLPVPEDSKLPIFSIGNTWQVICYLGRHKIDFVHLHDPLLAPIWGAGSRMGMAKMLLHLHTPFPDRWAVRIHAGYAKHILCDSLPLKRTLPPKLFTNAICMAPPVRSSQPAAKAKEMLRKELKASKDAVVIGFFDQLEEEGCCDRIAAFAEAFTKQIDRPFYGVFYGANPAQKIETIKEAVGKQASRFVWRGDKRPRTDALSACDVALCLQDNLSFPRFMIEAMALSVPLIASNNDGMADIITDGETGYLCPDNPEALAKAVCACLTDEEDRTARLRAAAKEVENLYLGKEASKKIMSLYDGL